MNKKSRFNKIIIFMIVFLLVAIIVLPIAINECYKVNGGYITLWEAKDLLSYLGAVFSCIGTIFVGIIALWQNERILKIEENRRIPTITINKCEINSFFDRSIDLLIYLKNTTNNVINILEVSPLNLGISSEKIEIPFCEDWNCQYSILPEEEKNINFFKEVKTSNPPILVIKEHLLKNFIQFKCEFTIKMQFVNSKEIYIQTINFFLYIAGITEKNSHMHAHIDSIENGIKRS